MARQRGTLFRADFTRGLITEASNLIFPENASTDELNFDITAKKTRRKRNGFDLEESHVVSVLDDTPSDLSNAYFSSGRWVAPGGDGSLEFASWQVGNKLYFFNTARTPVQVETLNDTRTSTDTPIDMDDFKSVGSVGLLSSGNPVTTATGNGFLFVAGEDINPFYVKYDPDTQEITSKEIIIKIRDTEGLDDGLEFNERPSTFDDEHIYNLANQGWYVEGIRSTGGRSITPLTHFFNTNGVYPSNADVWWTSRGQFDGNDPLGWNPRIDYRDSKQYVGNTKAPRGHYILDAFRRDRQAAVNIPVQGSLFEDPDPITVSLNIEDFGPSRPTTISFFAGRVWYAGQKGALHSNIFFSQVLEGEQEINRCYQKNDPTDEENSQLLATDGGVIKIPEVARIIKLQPFGEWLLVFASNGVWAIGGIDGQFTADGFRIKKVSSVNCVNPHAVVDARGTPFFWSDSGIYVVVPSEVDNSPIVQNISDQTIQTFFNDEIPKIPRLTASGGFDALNNRIYWLYRSTTTGTDETDFEYDKILIFDIKNSAFLPWEVFAGTLLQGPHIAGIIQVPTVGSTLGTTGVIDGTDNVIDGTDEVVVDTTSLSAVEATVKFLVKKNPLFRDLNTALSLSNMDFESGDFTGWTTSADEAAVPPVVSSADPLIGTVSFSKPATWGTYYVAFGNAAVSTVEPTNTISRTIDISGLDSAILAAIDNGDMKFTLRWDYFKEPEPTPPDVADHYSASLVIKDSGGTVVASDTIPSQEAPREAPASIDQDSLGPIAAPNGRSVEISFSNTEKDGIGGSFEYKMDNVKLFLSDESVITGEDSTDLEVTFGDFRRTDDYRDWLSVFTSGKNYNAYLETGHEFADEPTSFKTAPFIYSYLKKENDASLLLQGQWDFSNAVDSSEWTKKNQVYRDLKDDRDTVVTRTKIRGRGRALKLRWEAEEGKPAELLGWATEIERNAQS